MSSGCVFQFLAFLWCLTAICKSLGKLCLQIFVLFVLLMIITFLLLLLAVIWIKEEPKYVVSPPHHSSMPAEMTMLADQSARQLLDFSQKLDINLLDNVVNSMYYDIGSQVSTAPFHRWVFAHVSG